LLAFFGEVNTFVKKKQKKL